MNKHAAWIASGTLLGGLTLFFFATGALRSWGGDVLVVVFLVAALATPRWGSPRWRLLSVGLLSVGLELLQGLRLVAPDGHWLARLLLGSTFDPYDLLAYAIGLAIAAWLERWWSS